MSPFCPGDLARLDQQLLSPGETLALTDEPDPGSMWGYTNPETRVYSAALVKRVPNSFVPANAVLLVVSLNREEDPSHALVIAGDKLGWIVLRHLERIT